MRSVFNKLRTFKNLPLLSPLLERIEQIVQQRDKAFALHTEAVQTMFDLSALTKTPDQLEKYNRYAQKQCVALHANGQGRADLASKNLRGQGVEIGGLHCPVLLPENCKVSYVDRYPYEAQRKTFTELERFLLVVPSVIDAAETLSTLQDESLDFIIANHMLEHSENPIQVLFNFAEKLKAGGVVYMAIPDKRASFDKKRALTTSQHILDDYRNGPKASRAEHLHDFGSHVTGLRGEKLKNYVANFDHESGDIHYHVWTPETFKDLMDLCQKQEAWPYKYHQISSYKEEFIVLLNK